MREFVRITGNENEEYYMEMDPSTGYYEGEPLQKEEVLEMLLEDAVEKEIDCNFERIRQTICRRMDGSEQELVMNYLEHLEALVEAVE